MTCPTCAHLDHCDPNLGRGQGRDCQNALHASRRVFWLRPLPPDPAPQEDHGIYFWLAIVFAAFVAAYFQPF